MLYKAGKHGSYQSPSSQLRTNSSHSNSNRYVGGDLDLKTAIASELPYDWKRRCPAYLFLMAFYLCVGHHLLV